MKLTSFNYSSIIAILKTSNLAKLVLIDISLFVVMSILAPSLFLSAGNMSSMAVQFPGFGILALAMVLPMLTGGIDLSIIGLSNLTAILATLLLHYLLGPTPDISSIVVLDVLLAVTIALFVGALGGIINGFIIAYVGVSPILATLATGLIYTGLAVVVTNGSAVVGLPEAFGWIGNGTIFFIPVPVIIFSLAAVVLSYILSQTAFGAKSYLFGANAIASRFAGINNNTVTIKSYLVSGLYAAVAGLVIAARANSAKADYGSSYLLLAILICVLGGVNPFGGAGRVSGVVLAVLALQFLSSGLNLIGVNNFATELVWGVVLIFTMIVNQSALTLRK